MPSSRSSFPYLFMFTLFILIFVVTSLCAHNEQSVKCNKPFDIFANIQTLPQLLWFTKPPPQVLVPSRQFSELPQLAGSYVKINRKIRVDQAYHLHVAAKVSEEYDRQASAAAKNSDYERNYDPNQAVSPNQAVQVSPPQLIAPSPQFIVPPEVSVHPPAQSPQFTAPSPGASKFFVVPSPKRNWRLIIAIGIPTSVAGILITSIMIICSFKRGKLSRNAIVCWKGDGKRVHTNAEEFLKNYGSIFPKRYTYSDVKKLTNLFKEKIGQGGYGAVYKGQLPDGRIVAVKVLKESKGNGEEFINEVASISRTSHVNVVSLLGFCYERNKRALIYEFMPNGSLDKFIFDKGPSSSNDQLDKNKMFQIAIGIARGLEYLHRGCTTRILHFDIKPHNILLDEYLCPKISDFGLAKLCKIKESIVSMTGMRGTVGYIAPEVFSRNFGGVSHKSDVYSYGMLVLEMIGGRKNFDGDVSRTSEIYFPQLAYSKLELGESIGSFGEISEEEEETMKKMIIVSLWCIQNNPSDRPSMSKVIEMLEGTLQSLKLPPKPFLDSPTRSP